MARTSAIEGRTDQDELEELKEVRHKCMQTIRSRIAGSKVLGNVDIQIYQDEVISDKGLAHIGKVRHRDKIDYIREVEFKMLPELLAEAAKMETEFVTEIEKASRNGWISPQKANWWIKNLQDKSIPFHKKHIFIMTEERQGEKVKDAKIFKLFVKNWGIVADRAKELRKDPEIKKLSSADVAQIGIFLDEKQFLNLSFKNRDALVKTVDAALAAKKRQMPQLYSKAKTMLEWAVARQALSPSKMGVWLERIFKSEAKAKDIEQFLSNEGSNPLQRLVDNWMEASKNFHKIEAKRKSLGTPPGFHFVSMNVFLDWKFDKRTAYLEEADYRFQDISKEPELFLQIRHEMGSKDWDSAEELIEKAEQEDWGTENRAKLTSMKKFLQAHRSKADEEQTKEKQLNPSNEQVLSDMQALILELPWQLQKTYIQALNKGYQAFWALTTLMYNRVWCHQHNFLDKGKEKVIERKARVDTREHIEKGHKKFGWEANWVKGEFGESREAVRDQSGVKGAQILYTSDKSSTTVVDEINAQKNVRNFWYWTSMIPEGIQYEQHLDIVQRMHPKMKKLARLMHERGVIYPLATGDVTSAAAQEKSAGKSEVQHAMAA